jgi:hypothetical protein
VRAQEAVSNEVQLGSALFTVEDLENLDEAATLSSEQREVAQELLRSGMARARTNVLKRYRGMTDDFDFFGSPDEDAEKKLKEFAEKEKERASAVLEIEKSVMNDLKALLEPKQAQAGWEKFEASRRRLLLKSASQVAHHFQTSSDANRGVFMGTGVTISSFMNDGEIADMVAVVRAAKLSKEELASVKPTLDEYAATVDPLIKEYRAIAKPFFAKTAQSMYFSIDDGETAKPSASDASKFTETLRRIREATIRTARKIDETLKGEANEKFWKQRILAQENHAMMWQPVRRMPEVRAMLKLRSLTQSQKQGIKEAVSEGDRQMLLLARDAVRKQDEAFLIGKEDQTPSNPWEAQMTEEGRERSKKEREIYKKTIDRAKQILTDAQRSAYETGIESDQDLAKAFEKRRQGNQEWMYDMDLLGEHMGYDQADEDD